jgi:hypothetical protein
LAILSNIDIISFIAIGFVPQRINRLHWVGNIYSSRFHNTPQSYAMDPEASTRLPNFYLGGSAYVAPRPSAVRLRRSSRPAAQQQRHCTTMVLTAQRPRLLDLRRIRVRCVRCVTKVLSAAEAAIMSFLQDLSSLSSEPDSFTLIDIQSSRK